MNSERDFINDWPDEWGNKSIIYREGFQAGYYSNGTEIMVTYTDLQKDAYVAGVYHGRVEALAGKK